MISFQEREEQWRLLFDRLAPTYEREFNEHPYGIFYNEITWANIRKYLPQNKETPVLDTGGGTGFWSRKLAELGYRVICTDISKEMLREGRRIIQGTPIASRIDFVRAEITDMRGFPDESFSLVLAEGDPISYCSDPDKALKEMTRVAKKGAFVIASVDSFFGALWRMSQSQDFRELERLLKTGNTAYSGGEIQHNFTVEELRNLYLQNGLEVIDIIAKPVLTMTVPWEKITEILADKEKREKLLELELMFNNNPHIVGLGNHLEIVGRKK